MANTILHTPADVARWLLVLKGAGTSPLASPLGSWPVYALSEPDVPDDVVTTYDTQGVDHGRFMVGGALQGLYGFQVRVRSARPVAGWRKADEIQTLLAESVYQDTVTVAAVESLSAATYLVHCVSGIGDVLNLGYAPGSKRRLYTINALLDVKRVA